MKGKALHIVNYRRLPNIAMLFFVILIISSIKTFGITNALKLKIANATYSDETVIRYIQGATPDFDGNYDAWKIMSSNSAVPSIYTKILSSSPASINAYPALQNDEQVILFATVGTVGTYTITASEVGAFPSNIDIFIENISTGYFQNLRTNPVYTFQVSDITLFNANPENFKIHFSLPVQFSIPTFYSAGTCCIITKKGIDKWKYVVKDHSDNTMVSTTIDRDRDTLLNLLPGNYTIVSYFGNQATQAQTFMVYEAITQINNPSIKEEESKLYYSNNMLIIDFNNVLKHNVSLLVTTIEGREVVNAKLSDVSKFTVPMYDQQSRIYIVTLHADENTLVKKMPMGGLAIK